MPLSHSVRTGDERAQAECDTPLIVDGTAHQVLPAEPISLSLAARVSLVIPWDKPKDAQTG